MTEKKMVEFDWDKNHSLVLFNDLISYKGIPMHILLELFNKESERITHCKEMDYKAEEIYHLGNILDYSCLIANHEICEMLGNGNIIILDGKVIFVYCHENSAEDDYLLKYLKAVITRLGLYTCNPSSQTQTCETTEGTYLDFYAVEVANIISAEDAKR